MSNNRFQIGQWFMALSNGQTNVSSVTSTAMGQILWNNIVSTYASAAPSATHLIRLAIKGDINARL